MKWCKPLVQAIMLFSNHRLALSKTLFRNHNLLRVHVLVKFCEISVCVYMYIYIYIYVCMYVCTYVRMDVCVCVCAYVCTYILVHNIIIYSV